MSFFERGWLFNGSQKKKNEAPVADPAVAAPAVAVPAVASKVVVTPTVSAEDYDAWLCHLAKRNPLSRKPGMTMKDEYEQWMAARFKSQAAALRKKQPA
jgi:hypothetical protein